MCALTFDFKKFSSALVRQSERAECGLACLAMIASMNGKFVSLTALRSRFPVSNRGTSLRNLIDFAEHIGLTARPVRLEIEQIRSLRLPAVLHWNLNHFVVLEKVGRRTYTVLDPAKGKLKCSRKRFSSSFTGVALEFTRNKDFSCSQIGERLSVKDVLPISEPVKKALLHGLILSVFLQILILFSPFFMQTVIDDAIQKSDRSILLLIASGFAALKIFEIISNTIRSFVFQFMSKVLSYEMETNLFHHLIRLPLTYFQNRHIGDIQQRFGSLQAIKELFVNGAITSIVDGILALLIGIVLYIYSPLLASVVVGSILIYSALRVIFMKLSKRLSMDTMIAEADESSNFLESLRAIQTIKAWRIESRRETSWRNLNVKSLNAQIEFGNTNIVFRSVNQILLGLSNITIVVLASLAVIDGALTLGMMIAFIAYKREFEGRLMGLVETAISFRLLDVHLERISDIVTTEPIASPSPVNEFNKLDGEITLDRVSFSYQGATTPTLSDVSILIQPGEFIAVTGRSGAGKSTLLKLLCGLNTPSSGRISFGVDGSNTHRSAPTRNCIGMVLQDDKLLSGSIEENITLFSETPNVERVQEAAKLAAIKDEVDGMPMGFQTLVGDMGTSLSGGQCQRIILARALYAQPRILIMDEGTSHMDLETERKINIALKQLNITRIIAAHRPETIRSADRILVVADRTIKTNVGADSTLECADERLLM